MKHTRGFILMLFSLFVIAMTFGETHPEERRTALNKLIERAESGDAKALYDLAFLYDTGYDTIPVDSAKSTLLYRLSAEKGYAPARNYLGFRYFNGEYVKQDIDSGLYWIAKAAADGDVKGAANLGYLLAWSDKVKTDYPQAVYWLSKAADAGLPTAQSLLADLLKEGKGTETDTVRAVSLYRKAIKGGLHDAELKLLSMMETAWNKLSSDSTLNLGRELYNEGAFMAAVTLFEQAASQNNPTAFALLGDAYSKGLGVDYDHSKSLQLYLEAALLGNPSAQFVIGELLDIFPDALNNDNALEIILSFMPEEEVPEDIFSAEYWYESARIGGVTDADSASRLLLSGYI